MNIFDLIIKDKEHTKLEQVFLTSTNRNHIEQLIKEHRYINTLHQYGLPVNNKIMLSGNSGCGKTTTAKAIANALNKPILILNLSNIINSRVGETSQNIKAIFDKAGKENAVLFLDEFDQIGKARGNDDNDVGEMRRLVNTLIQLIDYYPEKSLLICATNHIHIIDKALLRRFQLHIAYELPTQEELDDFYAELLSSFPSEMQEINKQYGISYAEAKDSAYTQLKKLLIAGIEANKIAPNE